MPKISTYPTSTASRPVWRRVLAITSRAGLIVVVANVAEAAISSGVFPITKSYTVWTVATGTSLLWVVAMGVVLLRLKEPVAPDSVA